MAINLKLDTSVKGLFETCERLNRKYDKVSHIKHDIQELSQQFQLQITSQIEAILKRIDKQLFEESPVLESHIGTSSNMGQILSLKGPHHQHIGILPTPGALSLVFECG